MSGEKAVRWKFFYWHESFDSIAQLLGLGRWM